MRSTPLSTLSLPDASRLARFIAALVLVTTAGCTDAPVVPEGEGAPGAVYLTLQPQFATSALDDNAVAAQQAAFDMVDRYRAIVRRIQSGEVVKDTVVEVEEGAEAHELSIPLTVSDAETTFTLELMALDGETVLFSVEATVTASTDGGAGGGGGSAVPVTLEYTGPGATAASLEIVPSGLVVSPGGTGAFRVRVLDDEGRELGGVPTSWSSEGASVVTVTGTGNLTGVAEGQAQVTVGIANGLTATARVYVVGGELAYASSGHVYQAAPGARTGTDRTPGAVGARRPAWAPNGARLFYEVSGTVREAGGGLSLEGAWPSVSPDGSKLAVERGGRVFFANSDGSRATAGPTGRQPQWSGGSEVVVSGGSIERVDAAGGGRETVVSGEATDPAVGPDGRVAYVRDGGLFVAGEGGANLLGEGLAARSRPAWSPNGRWLAVSAALPSFPSTLHVVPADGSGPAVALTVENTSTELDPAWRPEGPPQATPAVVVEGLEPSRPLPGQVVEIRGTGFDGIITSNNRVFFPTSGGSVEADVLEAGPTTLRARVPSGVTEGTLRVATFTGEGTLGLSPSTGDLVVRAVTSYGKGVSGIDVRLVQGESTVGAATTDAGGEAAFPDLFTGSYRVEVTGVRDGFGATAPGGAQEVVLDGTTTVALDVEVEVRGLELRTASSVEFEAPGASEAVAADAVDVDGDVIPSVAPGWTSSNEAVAGVESSGREVSVTGHTPGEATVTGTAAEHTVTVDVTVGGAVSGVVVTEGGKAVDGSAVEIRDGEGEVLGEATTDGDGAFRFTGLPVGTLVVEVTPRDGFTFESGEESQSAVVATGTPEPELTFEARAEVRGLSIQGDGIVLEAPGEEQAVEARVVDVDGDVVAGAEVEWTVADERVAEVRADGGAAAALVSDATVRIVGLTPGETTLTAAAGGNEASTGLSVRGGVRGTVRYDYDAPFQGAVVVLSDADGEVARTESDAGGAFLFGGLEVGAYTLTLELPDGFTAVGEGPVDVTVATGEGAPEAAFLVDPEVRRLEVEVGETEMQLGDETTGTATALDARDEPVPNAEVTWESSDSDVVEVHEDGGGGAALASLATGLRVRIEAVGPGSATVTVTADEAEAAVDMEVRGAVQGRLVRTDGSGFAGATVHLTQDGSAVRDPVTTGSDGVFAFLNVDPGEYRLRVDLPAGFSIDGDNPRTVVVGPGLGSLELVVRAGIQRVVISPAEPVVGVDESLTVTATALDARGDPITDVSARWSPITGHVSASGSTLEGRLRGNFPTAAPGEARFKVTIDAQSFEFGATVTSRISGRVTDGSGNGVGSLTIELFRGESRIATALTAGNGDYVFRGLSAGSYTVRPIPPADEETVSPTQRSLTLGSGNPTGTANFVLGGDDLGPIDLSGRPVLVFGDYPARSSVSSKLGSLGMDVTLSTSLPEDLSPYQAIFHIGAFVALTASERAQLEAFVNTGAGLHLTGERPCCEIMNNAHEPLINALVAGGGVQLGGLGDFHGTFPFNPTSVGGIPEVPNVLPGWDPSSPGGMTGVSGSNVLVTHSASGTPVGAVWAEGDMSSGVGRLTVLMDVNWPDKTGATEVLENLATFLVRKAPAAALTAQNWVPGAVKFLDDEPPADMDAVSRQRLREDDPTKGPTGEDSEPRRSGGEMGSGR